MKDQNSIQGVETKGEKWYRAKALFLESVIKPDSDLRSCAHNQHCYYELMEIRSQIMDYVAHLHNPHQ